MIIAFRNIMLGLALLGASISAARAHEVPHDAPNHDIAAQARYIANAGVLIAQGKTKIMFDPIALSGFGIYSVTPEAVLTDMMEGKGIYGGVDAVFISHAHADHFSAKTMVAYMQARKKVKLIAPRQALEAMQQDVSWSKKLLKRVIVIDLEAGAPPQDIKLKNIRASAVRIPHAGWPAPKRAAVENLVYRVTLDKGATLMHMGDADPNPVHFAPHADYWQAQKTDTAFPPYWFFVSDAGQAILSNDINAGTAIGVHVPIAIPPELQDSGADYFSRPGETRDIAPSVK